MGTAEVWSTRASRNSKPRLQAGGPSRRSKLVKAKARGRVQSSKGTWFVMLVVLVALALPTSCGIPGSRQAMRARPSHTPNVHTGCLEIVSSCWAESAQHLKELPYDKHSRLQKAKADDWGNQAGR